MGLLLSLLEDFWFLTVCGSLPAPFEGLRVVVVVLVVVVLVVVDGTNSISTEGAKWVGLSCELAIGDWDVKSSDDLRGSLKGYRF